MDWTAAATLILAGTTLLLVFATFQLGVRASEDTRAQWRPILLVSDSEPEGLSLTETRLSVLIENVGRGPALEVTGMISGVSGFAEKEKASRNVSSLAPGRSVRFDLKYEDDGKDVVIVQLAYSDISKAGYATSFVIGRVKPRLVLLAQDVEMHGLVTFWWHSLAPRRFRHYLWPLTRRALRRRGYDV